VKRALIVSFAAGVAFLPLTAVANDAKNYVGISVGSSFSNHLEKSANQGGFANNFNQAGVVKSHRRAVAGKLFVGMEVMPYLDVRASLIEMDALKLKERTQGTELTQEMRGLYVEGLLKQPFTDSRSEIFAKAGAGVASTKIKGKSDNAYASKSNTGLSLSLGLGFNHSFSNNFGVVFEVERFFTDHKDLAGKSDTLGYKSNLYTLGGFYRF